MQLTRKPAHALLAIIVLLATLLAGAWALFVPMMQEPDESAHIDYAFSILTAERVSLWGGRPISTDVHPYTRYLEVATGFRGMRYSSFGRVPSGYGTAAFFARIDRQAPKVSAASSDTRPLPLYARSYPFGFYALEAAVMAIVARFDRGSIVAEYFAARFFCVALLVPTLLCSYGIFRYLRFSRALSLVLTASIAFFPLTSSIFSYVQPDDLVAALVAAIILAALHLRDAPSMVRAATVGVLLAALALTKYHDALVMMAVIVFMVSTSGELRKKLALIVAPAAIAFGTSAAVMLLPAGAQHLLCPGLAAPLHRALGSGPAALWAYLVKSTLSFVTNDFIAGWPFVEYWAAVGWIPRRFVIFSESTTNAALALLGFATIVTLLLMLMRAARVAQRLVSLARERSIATAVRMLSRDVVLNAYLAYLAFLLAANLYSANFLQHGRYGLPFLFCALLCAVRYVPHFAARRFERPLAATIAGALAMYSALTAVPALATVDRTYYIARAPIQYEEAFANFDGATTGRLAKRISQGTALAISGYAVDGPSEALARNVSLLVDGTRRTFLHYGGFRRDVLCTFNDVSLAHSGFRGTLDTTLLEPGRHRLELQISERGFVDPVRTASRISFVVERAPAGATRRLRYPSRTRPI